MMARECVRECVRDYVGREKMRERVRVVEIGRECVRATKVSEGENSHAKNYSHGDKRPSGLRGAREII